MTGRTSEACYAAALANLPGMGPATLCRILAERAPEEAWSAVRAGQVTRPARPAGRRDEPAGRLDLGDDVAGLSLVSMPGSSPGRGRGAGGQPQRPWADLAAAVDPPAWWARYEAAGVGVTWRGRPDYPAPLVEDPQPPGVLFWVGDLACLDRRRVAVVGTRAASSDGRAVAFEMGRDLAAAGVCVISGLALGIDGACHAGALDAIPGRSAAGTDNGTGTGTGTGTDKGAGAPAGPVGVAASGVDVPYPREHRQLWQHVAEAGAIVSETPPGRAAQAWMFPSRNRLIAGLAEMVVVVESHQRGGSLITAEAAIERGVDVRVVPGPVRSPASAGSNQLLCDGPGPVRDAGDVLDALGLPRAAAGAITGGRRSAAPAAPDTGRPQARLGEDERAVLEGISRRPVGLDQLMAVTGLGLAALHRALESLARAGLVAETRGWWIRC